MTRQSIRLTQGETKCCLLVMLPCLVAVADNRSTYISQDKITNNRPAYIYLFIAELPTLTLSPCDTRFCLFSHTLTPHIQLLTQKKKNDLGPRLVRSFSNSPMVLDGADGVYGWLHPEVSNRRRDTPKDNERNYHLEKSDDESGLRLGV